METLRRVLARLKLGAICAIMGIGGYFAAPHLRDEAFLPVAKSFGKPGIDYAPTGVAHPRKKKAKPLQTRDAD